MYTYILIQIVYFISNMSNHAYHIRRQFEYQSIIVYIGPRGSSIGWFDVSITR